MREDWIKIDLGEICNFVGGGIPSKKISDFWNGPIPWASIKDIKGDYLNKTKDYITENGLENSSTNLALPNEIIIGTRISPGKPIITKIKTAINQDLKIVKPKITLSTPFLFYVFKNIERKIIKVSSGTTVLGINLNNLREIKISLAPLPEQRAIVAKIEQLFSELDNGVANLKAAKDKLEIYREAVLQKAFEGELTKEWRKKHSHELDSAEVLLKKIKLEQEEHFQQQLNDWTKTVKQWEADGKLTKKPAKPRKAQEPEPITTDELKLLPQIASSWKYRRLAQIATIGSGMSVSKNRKLQDPIEVPYLRVANVQRGKLVLDNMKHMKIERNDLPKLQLHKWDILFNEGGDRDKLGRGWIWESQVEPCITQNHVFRVTTYTPDAVTGHWFRMVTSVYS